MELRNQEEKYFGADSDANHLEIIDAEGSYLFGPHGKKYIDFTSGWCVGNFGWASKEIRKSVFTLDGPTYVSPNFEYRPWVELAELLADITPGKLKKSFRATGGTEAVEIALQAAIAYTGREKFIAVEDAYHGNSIAARALNSDEGPQPFVVKRIKPPFTIECADQMEKWLKNRDIAALVMEPVVTNIEVEIPTQSFMDRIQELCRKYGTLIIMDEVATGFGRTGKLFACEHFGMEPDIMCLAKSLTGGLAPIGATIMTEKVAEALVENQFPYSTYGWHPLSVSAAIANIKYLQENWPMIDDNARSLSEYFQQRLSEMDFKSEVDIRVMGPAIGLKFKDDDYGEKLAKRALKKGLVLDDGVCIFPALTMDIATAKKGLDILGDCL